MKLLAIGAAALALAFGIPAQAQMSTTVQEQAPNGNIRTTTRVQTPDGAAATRTVDRMDGSRRVVRQSVDANGNGRTVIRDSRRPGMRRVCRTHWRHGHRERRCWTRHR